MRILAIRGKNLASLEDEFEIDFTIEPLRSAGIFAITGNTGAGKSTILDALCLALFDDTPRTNRAKESVAVPDVRDKLINQKDCRTILRRGTGEGYAEVDFVSLGGEKFRTRWMVKRARSKADGSMQNSEIRLFNLSADIEQQGRKTELLAKITELIGLTFEQFTRSVLLAQGDFATFLKARQAEKAELLEKLTGTEIYSRISRNIYEKTKGAEQEYLALMTRVKDVELLSEERLAGLQAEKSGLSVEADRLKNMISHLSQKITWFTEEEKLEGVIREAYERQSVLLKEMEQAMSRFDYLSQIEKAQEIRDVYQEWRHMLQQCSGYQQNRIQQHAAAQANETALTQARQVFHEVDKEQREFDEKVRQLEPQLVRARELDVKATGVRNNLAEYEKEWQQAEQNRGRLEKMIAGHQKQLEQNLKSTGVLEDWFKRFRSYETLVPRAELIVSLLDDVSVTHTQLAQNGKFLGDTNELLLKEQEHLSRLQQEAERLHQLLPAEVMAWRSRLQEGQPCPVCGSIHHPWVAVSEGQALQEEELEKAKKEIAGQIADVLLRIEQRQTEITRLNTLIGNYKEHAGQIEVKLESYFSALPGGRGLIGQEELQSQLKKIAAQWVEYTDEKRRLQEQAGQLQATLVVEQDNLREVVDTAKIRQDKFSVVRVELDKLEQERGLLLKGKAVEAVERACAERREMLMRRIKACTDAVNELTVKQETYKATLLQIDDDIVKLDLRTAVLRQEIQDWLMMQEKEMSFEKLTELLGQDLHWIQEEKRFLGGLKEQEQAIKVAITERKLSLSRHQEAEIRPQKGVENQEMLQNKLLESNMLLEQQVAQLAEIELLLVNHQKNQIKVKSFEKELSEKGTITNNWKKLNELLGSASGAKFQEIAQGYTLDLLLMYANKHLRELSDRYKLQRIPDTLALQVVDLDMLSETRAIYSLSGGESFLISLALALGLASLSSNRMNVESLFIDEGFGSLDADTLRMAMDALERLHTQGRKIGVISHVPEMTERITARIQVSKSSNGRSQISIAGLS